MYLIVNTEKYQKKCSWLHSRIWLWWIYKSREW